MAIKRFFLKAAVFHAIGGFPELPIMEDFVMMQTLKRTGKNCDRSCRCFNVGSALAKTGRLPHHAD
jgi:hypothetical protein